MDVVWKIVANEINNKDFLSIQNILERWICDVLAVWVKVYDFSVSYEQSMFIKVVEIGGSVHQ